MEKMGVMLKDFYKGKKVFISGHTGFKGTWMSYLLHMLGSEVYGYSLPPEEGAMFQLLQMETKVAGTYADIRRKDQLQKAMCDFQPDIVIHMAAQPIVRASYEDPVYTYEANIMGTVYLLEAVRNCKSVKSVVNVTTDKVYENKEQVWGYRENEPLNGYDPYSNSKSCSDLITQTYQKAFLSGLPVSICRAGNVIGGGDFSKDRIVPDCYRAACSHEMIYLRNPFSIRPYQHVLEAVSAYLYIAMKQCQNIHLADTYNIGPVFADCRTTGEVATLFCENWGNAEAGWRHEQEQNAVHESNCLKLDCSKIMSQLNWRPCWNFETAIMKTTEWYRCLYDAGNLDLITSKQIAEYMKEAYLSL